MNTASRCSHFLTTASSSDPEFLAALNAPIPANFIWLTPNDNDNGHDSGVSGGDSYLATLVPKILASTEFTTTKATLLVLYDEGYNQCTNTGGTGECVYASFSGPAAKQGVRSVHLMHLTTRTCRQSRLRGDYHRSTQTTQEHRTCLALSVQHARRAVLHLPSQQASQHHPPLLS